MGAKFLRTSSIFFLAVVGLHAELFADDKVKIDANTFGAIEARHLGPAVMGGRIMAIEAVNTEPRIIYVGTASGGVWKSINGGTTFKPIFDKYTQSIGALAIDQAHPDTVWVGTGESCTRNSVSVGTGLYKSTDGGENWKLVGLEKSERISKIVIHPRHSEIVYVAVPGHLWDANDERGLYKTTDGGKTWERILYVDANTGCSDLAIDPQEPDILYAAMWQFRRLPYFFTSGGPGSGLYKSSDGGKTWKKLTAGLPEGDLGRIAIAVAPSRPSVVYAVIEARKTALYRSDDFGENWTKVNSSFNVTARPFYFSHLVVDPKDYRRVYKPGFSLSVSSDGGQSFTSPFTGEGGGAVHSDHHALWINPHNTFQLLLGTDGGVYASYDKGNTWRFLRNLPVSQFYHVSYDLERPYNVYGGLQDNGTWVGPSQSPNGIENRDWQNIGAGDGFYVFPDPTDKDIVYCEYQGGNVLRYHKSTGETKEIKPYPREGEPKYRFNWNTPMALSPNHPNVIYLGAQFLFRSIDRGDSWERISDDLTTNDPAKQKQEESGGLTIDNSTAENHCTIFTISESPRDEKVIWAGTDDGNLQITTDGGKTWSSVVGNIPGLPPNTWCACVEASHFGQATAYVVFDGHQTGDMNVYVYKTTDLGKTWKSLATETIKGYGHVIREDLVNPNLLFLGTEFGLFVSVDGGEQWAPFTGNLPNVSVYDIAIHPRESDVILATHGRGIMIIDDITPLRQITPEVLAANVFLLDSRPSVITIPTSLQDFPGDGEYVGNNPGEVAIITYYLKDRHVFGDLKVEVYDAQGKLMTTLPGGKRRGINRVKWYMRLKPPKVPPAPTLAGRALFGPMVPEGTYTIKLVKGNDTYTGQIKLVADSKLPHSAEDRAVQQQAVMKLYHMQERLAFISAVVTEARDQARERTKKLKPGEQLAKALEAFAEKLDGLHKTLVATKEGFLTGEEQLREKIVDLYGAVSSYGGRPTASQLARMAVLEKEIEKSNAAFEALVGKELIGLNAKLQGKKLDPIKILTKEEYDKRE
ncbi:MAG: glycosyl hydrolase [candidate division KSB1 bacterium]|nr:glycosyl hydrolase [candidate division KSB1 bacterium]MDZ7304884.1 glycosyl hydrolase [candidate division KSB1 bacterium]MDZ7314368.1 glycosyl hydrolase [candidate division KSB1 bacterium]